MKSYKDQILDHLRSWNRSVYRLNTEGAKYYGATFYERNAWDGSFEYNWEDAEKYEIVYDLKANKFVKEKA